MSPLFTPLFDDPEKIMVMGIINISPESFYKQSIAKGQDEDFGERLLSMQSQGADMLDLGAMSTAPYLETQITEEEEAERFEGALNHIPEQLKIPFSVDTSRCMPAELAIKRGCPAINDVHGFEKDDRLLSLAKHYRSNVILMANESQLEPADISIDQAPERIVFSCLKHIRDRAIDQGIEPARIILDPGIGFFRNHKLSWYEFDLRLLKSLPLFRELGHPLLVSVSRKSFLGILLNRENPDDRLPGSLGATWAALEGGAQIIRTHDVAETVDLVKMYQLFRQQ